MAVLTSKGISPARASQALSLQGRITEAELVVGIEGALGSAYAGMWLEPAAAKLHIGVTSKTSGNTAERVVAEAGLSADVVYSPVRSTWAALMAAQNRWNKRLAKLPASADARTAIDFQRNAVAVALSSSVPARERLRLTAEAAAASVNVYVTPASPSQPSSQPKATCEATFQQTAARCETTLTSGVAIETRPTPECIEKEIPFAGGYTNRDECEPPGPGSAPSGGKWIWPTCTAGPMLIKGTETYMLTAGHCFGDKIGEGKVTYPVFSAYPSAALKTESALREIGDEGKWYRNKERERDIAEVRIKPPPSPFTQALPNPVPALMAEWAGGAPAPATPHTVEGVLAAESREIQNQTICHEGQKSGERCGEVKGVNVTNTFATSEGPITIEHLVEQSACSNVGDSGGPYFFRANTGAIFMLGTEVGGPGDCFSETTGAAEPCVASGSCINYFEPLEGIKVVGGVEQYGTLPLFKKQGQVLLTKYNEKGECVSSKKGRYKDTKCTEEDVVKGKPEGKYEWVERGSCYSKKHGLYKDAMCKEPDEKKGKPKGKYEIAN